MTPQTIRLSFLIFERLIKSANALLTTVAFGAGLIFLILQAPTLRMGMDALFSRVGQLQSLEAFNLKMAFGEANVLEALPFFKGLDNEKQATLRADLQDLDSEWLPRLLNVGALEGTCEYERTTPDIRESYEADQKLHSLGLVDFHQADDAKAKALADMKAALAKGQAWEAGTPRQCYRMTLTGRGWRIKTAVLQFLAKGLTTGAPATAQAHGPTGKLRVARGD